MKTPLAWRNVSHERKRSVAALCGISFSILLIFMQLGFYAGTRNGATLVYETLAFDVLVISPHYSFIARPGSFARSRLEQVRAVPGVEKTMPIWIGFGEWRNVITREGWGMLLVGVEPEDRPFLREDINRQLPALHVPDNALVERGSRREFGPHQPGLESELSGHRVRVVGDYAVGTGLVAGSTAITSRQTLRRIDPQQVGGRVSLGLVKLTPGADLAATVREMEALVAPEARVFTRAQLAAMEQDFWLNTKPIGIMFTSGVLVAFTIGAVILYQVLASEVQNRLREYATLKALGYGSHYVYGVVLKQGVIFSLLGFAPAWIGSLVLYHLLRTVALLPVWMEWTRIAGVLGLAIVMCLLATFFAVRKLRAADPADLF